METTNDELEEENINEEAVILDKPPLEQDEEDAEWEDTIKAALLDTECPAPNPTILKSKKLRMSRRSIINCAKLPIASKAEEKQRGTGIDWSEPISVQRESHITITENCEDSFVGDIMSLFESPPEKEEEQLRILVTKPRLKKINLINKFKEQGKAIKPSSHIYRSCLKDLSTLLPKKGIPILHPIADSYNPDIISVRALEDPLKTEIIPQTPIRNLRLSDLRLSSEIFGKKQFILKHNTELRNLTCVNQSNTMFSPELRKKLIANLRLSQRSLNSNSSLLQ